MKARSGSGRQPAGGTAAPSLWRFGPDSAPVVVRNAEAVLAHLPLFLGGWPPRFAGPGDAPDAAPDIDIVERRDGIDLVTAGVGQRTPCTGAMEAAGALADALIGAFVARHPAMVCLNAGAALTGAGLVVLVGAALSGKSSVALHLAAAGHRLFGDDRIAIDLAADGSAAALCLGLLPRVRLPLPSDCGARFAEFVEGYTEIQDEAAAWLKPWAGEAATFGETAPLGVLVVLERVEGADATLTPLPPPALLRALGESAAMPRSDLLERLAGAAPGYRLRFGSSRAAAALLAARLATRS